jgi:hypothetical protein
LAVTRIQPQRRNVTFDDAPARVIDPLRSVARPTA